MQKTTDQHNIILIGIDTLRADHLGCYGYHRPTSPAIDALAKESVLFENCFSQAPITAPSFMSIMTSRYPTYHGVVSNIGGTGRGGRMYVLDQNIPTMAEILKKEGYVTGAFTDGGNLYGKLGFDRGFEYYSMNLKYEFQMPGIIPKDEIFKWLESNSSKKFYLFFHTFAVHNPWAVPNKYLKIFDHNYNGKLLVSQLLMDKLKRPGRSPRVPFLEIVDKEDKKDIDYLKAIYDSAVRYVDDFVGELLAFLEKLKIDKNTIIVFTADHGEEFLEHGILGHKQFYNELLHVPLIIKAPGFKEFVKINDEIQSIDIMPTVLDLLNIRNIAPIHGMSLISPRSRDNEPITLAEAQGLGYAIRYKKYKYIFPAYKSYKVREDELYDLEKDPSENNNIALQNLDIVEEMLCRREHELYSRVTLPHPRRKIIYLEHPFT
ncbi:MAG: sulfatase [bacterium]|nr:sulfatase [bacterium]